MPISTCEPLASLPPYALLAANHREGVPLYLYYPPGRPPVLLPQLLDPAILHGAISAP